MIFPGNNEDILELLGMTDWGPPFVVHEFCIASAPDLAAFEATARRHKAILAVVLENSRL